MKNISQKKQEIEEEDMNPMTVAVTAAVLGAVVAVAGVIALREENRQKMKDAVKDTKKRAGNYIDDKRKEAKDNKKLLEDKIAKGKEKLEEAAYATKEALFENQQVNE